MITDAKLEFWINNNYNVLLRGLHGIGKSSIVIDAFNNASLKWLYFSAATMDPWVDFVGVPKEKIENGNSYLELVRPRHFQNDEIEAIFFDEFNRAPAKVRNAVMELLQFKSINGKKFNNLRMIWAGINPPKEDSDEIEYDVDMLDPAQQDRFHVIIDLPYKPHLPYFRKKYDDKGDIAVKWWNALDQKSKMLISPRRLDYALDMYNKKGDIRDVIDRQLNVHELIQQLAFGSYIDRAKSLLAENNLDIIKKEMNDINFSNYLLKELPKNVNYVRHLFPYFSSENQAKLLTTNQKVRSEVLSFFKYDDFSEIVDPILSAKTVKGKPAKELLNWSKTSQTTITNIDAVEYMKELSAEYRRANSNNSTINKENIIQIIKTRFKNDFTKEITKKTYSVLINIIANSYENTFMRWEPELILATPALFDALNKNGIDYSQTMATVLKGKNVSASTIFKIINYVDKLYNNYKITQL